ncbi:MAG: selenocysteine-specific translation elongation factor [Alphaproteobacteria bacterium]|nr:selenocysteine-specific translation elongation factor [Alphaproteobacteria bacterium]
MIVATAGHIDHGKTLLVRAITGINADRLPEEKKRGMTIDLGFAYHRLSQNKVLGFVDVPGHERFIGNMLAGVTGIDYSMLVIAADDGPMPQTREHLSILNLLGIKQCVIALTKIDRVNTGRLTEVTAAINSLLDSTDLVNSPIFPVSAVTGEGVKELSNHLYNVANNYSEKITSGNFRLAIDRAFTIAGAGLVVTGTVFSGFIEVGSQVFLSSTGQKARIREIHSNNKKSNKGSTGQRCAINLSNIDKAVVNRGDWLVSSSDITPVSKIDTELHILDTEIRPLRHWTPVHLHLGAAHVTGHIAILESNAIDPGSKSLAQIVLDSQISALSLDRFIIRDQSAQRTLGGGHIIDIFPPRRRRSHPNRIAMLKALNTNDNNIAFNSSLKLSNLGLDVNRFSVNRNLTDDQINKIIDKNKAIIIGNTQSKTAFHKMTWQQLKIDTLAALDLYHNKHTDILGPGISQLRKTLINNIPESIFHGLINVLLTDGSVNSEGTLLHLPNKRIQLSPEDEKLWMIVLPLLIRNPNQPPVIHDLAKKINIQPDNLNRFLHRVTNLGLAIQISKNRFYERDSLTELAYKFEVLSKELVDGVTPSKFRDQAGMGRNLTIELLEYFDRCGLSKRSGNIRTLVKPAREIFQRNEDNK